MGIKDQFSEKAQELKGKASQAAKGVQDEASERSRQLREKKPPQGQAQPQAKRPPADRARDEFDENWDA
ncbi:hypothetical protein AB0D66_12225 [Streptomyces sp. NPDC048270]|uniref:hypothetical protein n=1 Tax=Streptomyces sp. NPDC048270 TaxID=3154615 RepID=UPI0033D29EB1